jgi:hypothetical protein
MVSRSRRCVGEEEVLKWKEKVDDEEGEKEMVEWGGGGRVEWE